MGEPVRVVCAVFDDGLDAGLRDVVADLAAEGTGIRHPLRHAPHLTLAGAPGTVPLDDVTAATAALAAAHEPFPVRFQHAGVFTGRRGSVLWLGPDPDPALTALQAAADDAVLGLGAGRALDTAVPGRWVAHCTLGTGLTPDGVAAATALLARRGWPAPGRVTGLAVVLAGALGEHAVVPLGRQAERLSPRRAASGSG